MKGQPVVSIIGGTFWGNRGAESMLVTVIGKLRESNPAAKFYVFSYYSAKDRELVSDDSIIILSGKPLSLISRHFFGALFLLILRKFGVKSPKGDFFKIARALSESDILLDIGGITFSDGREKYLPFNILTIWPAMMLKVPVIKLAQAVGPFRNTFNYLCAKLFLFRCGHIFARGEKTAEFLDILGYPSDRFDTVADIAFLYELKYSLSVENNEKVDTLIKHIKQVKKNGKKVIVFSPSILVDEESRRRGLEYPTRLFEAVRELGPESCHYVFIPNATRESSEKSHNNDILTINRMRNAASNGGLPESFKDAIEWVNYDINSASIRRIIGESDALVTSRYHAMISGLSLSVPTVVLGWGHKYRETMAYFDLADYSLDFSSSELLLGDIISDLLIKSASVKQKIGEHLPAIKTLAEIQFSYLGRVLS